MSKTVAPALLTLFISTVVFAQERAQKPSPKQPQQPAYNLNRGDAVKGMKPPSGPSFYIANIEGSTGMFSVLLGDGGGKTVAGTFSLQQLEVFEAVLEAAKEFALTDEKVGSNNPITTRLMEQHEWSFFVDVSKMGDKSRFFISLVAPQGRLTIPAGEITRGSKKEHSALFLDVLSRVKDTRASFTPSR